MSAPIWASMFTALGVLIPGIVATGSRSQSWSCSVMSASISRIEMLDVVVEQLVRSKCSRRSVARCSVKFPQESDATALLLARSRPRARSSRAMVLLSLGISASRNARPETPGTGGGNRGAFDSGGLDGLLDLQHLSRMLFGQRCAVPGHVPLPRIGVNKRAADESVRTQLGQPLRVRDAHPGKATRAEYLPPATKGRPRGAREHSRQVACEIGVGASCKNARETGRGQLARWSRMLRSVPVGVRLVAASSRGVLSRISPVRRS